MAREDIVPLARQHIGEEYVFGAMVNYTIATHSGPWDCAEFATWCIYQATGKLLGVEPDDPRNGDAYTGFWGDDARASGLIVPIQEALDSEGYVLLRIPRSGRIGHIAISVGNGRDVVEAASRNLGVVERSAIGRPWDYGVRIPDEDTDLPENGSNAGLVFRATRNPRYDRRVEQIQTALRNQGHSPGPIDGRFGPATETAVMQFQLAEGIVVDGIVSRETGNALGLNFWDDVPGDDHVPNPDQTTTDPGDHSKDYFTVANPNFRALVAGGSFSNNPHLGGGKRAFRTNNPGAINFDFNGGGAWQAQIPGFVGRTFADNAGNKTAIYESPEQGIAAWFYLFTNRYGFGGSSTVSIRELSRRYAGVGSWMHAAARSYVSGWTRYSEGNLTATSRINFGSDDSLKWFGKGVFGHELGEASALSEAQLIHGIGLGRSLLDN